MNYQVDFHISGSGQIPGLPAEAFCALIKTLVEVGVDPWATGMPTEEPVKRQAVFSEVGLVCYRVDDAAKTVSVHHITWAG